MGSICKSLTSARLLENDTKVMQIEISHDEVDEITTKFGPKRFQKDDCTVIVNDQCQTVEEMEPFFILPELNNEQVNYLKNQSVEEVRRFKLRLNIQSYNYKKLQSNYQTNISLTDQIYNYSKKQQCTKSQFYKKLLKHQLSVDRLREQEQVVAKIKKNTTDGLKLKFKGILKRDQTYIHSNNKPPQRCSHFSQKKMVQFETSRRHQC